MDEIRGPAGRNMWQKLGNIDAVVLANFLKNEYPQTIAVVLSKLKPEHAARVLAILPEDLALDVIARMLKMKAVQKVVHERVEQLDGFDIEHGAQAQVILFFDQAQQVEGDGQPDTGAVVGVAQLARQVVGLCEQQLLEERAGL